MKVQKNTSHVRESAKDKAFGGIVTVILVVFAIITAILSDFGNRGLFEFQDGIADEYDQSASGGIYVGFMEISSR